MKVKLLIGIVALAAAVVALVFVVWPAPAPGPAAAPPPKLVATPPPVLPPEGVLLASYTKVLLRPAVVAASALKVTNAAEASAIVTHGTRAKLVNAVLARVTFGNWYSPDDACRTCWVLCYDSIPRALMYEMMASSVMRPQPTPTGTTGFRHWIAVVDAATGDLIDYWGAP